MGDIVGKDAAVRWARTGNITRSVGSNASIDFRNDVNQDQGTREAALNLAQKVVATHPTYDDEAPKWRKYLDLYEANDVYRYIYKHARESDDFVQRRTERGYYNNYVASVIDLFTAYIYSGQITRDVPDDLKKLFMEEVYPDANRSGKSWDMFWQDVCKFSLLEGHVGILIDSPRLEEEISEADRKELGVRPYLQMFHAFQILDWELDEFGGFEFVKLEFKRPEKRTWDQPNDQNARNVLVYTKEDWSEFLVTKDGDGPTSKDIAVLIDSGPNPVPGTVPFFAFKFLEQAAHPWFGKSFVKEIADINIAILNWSSLADEEIYERCLNVLVMQTPDEDKPIKLGHGNVLAYDGDIAPHYLTPGTTPLEGIMRMIDFEISEIQRLAKLKGSTGLKDVRQATSGIAYAFEFNETNQSLCTKVVVLEQAEEEVHRLISLFTDSPANKSEFVVKYPREFGVDDALVDFQTLQLARDSLTSKTAIDEVEKRIVRRHLPKINPDTLKKIDKEIEEEPNPGPSLEEAFGMVPNPLGGQPFGEEPEPSEDSGATSTGDNNTR